MDRYKSILRNSHPHWHSSLVFHSPLNTSCLSMIPDNKHGEPSERSPITASSAWSFLPWALNAITDRSATWRMSWPQKERASHIPTTSLAWYPWALISNSSSPFDSHFRPLCWAQRDVSFVFISFIVWTQLWLARGIRNLWTTRPKCRKMARDLRSRKKSKASHSTESEAGSKANGERKDQVRFASPWPTAEPHDHFEPRVERTSLSLESLGNYLWIGGLVSLLALALFVGPVILVLESSTHHILFTLPEPIPRSGAHRVVAGLLRRRSRNR